MSTPPPDSAPAPQPWPPPGEVAALEPGTLPTHPLRAQDCPALIAKEVG